MVISATEPLKAKWNGQAGGVYVAKIDPPPAQLFFDGQMAREAHWPNGAYGDLMDKPSLKAEQGMGYEQIVCKGLPPGDFNGGCALIWRGGGPDWLDPNFIIMRPNGGTPAPFEPRAFLARHAGDVVLDNIHLASSAQGAHQSCIGDLAEVLVFDRRLRFDEILTVQNYFRLKWSLKGD